MQMAVDLDRKQGESHLRPARLRCRGNCRRCGEILVVEVGRQVRVARFIVRDDGEAVILRGALVARHNVPPQSAAEFAFQWREIEVPSVAMKADGLGGASGEAVKCPVGAAAVVIPETCLLISHRPFRGDCRMHTW